MPIDLEYLRFCRAGHPFYSPVDTSKASKRLDDGLELPKGWMSRRDTPWTMCWKPDAEALPEQGWKVHISATRKNSRRVLAKAFNFCINSGIAFKYLSTEADFDSQNSKYADRGAAGKFVTIYPASNEDFRLTLENLDEYLEGEEGPYILSDKRWKQTPVFYRYGAFKPSAPGSKYISSLKTLDGREVEDVRRPTYILPDWVEVPAFLNSTNNSDVDVDFPFKMESALHFSNGGGVYIATALTDEFVSTGTKVVLKEARPHAAVDTEGHDAVHRLNHEVRVLRELEPTGYVPKCYGVFKAWEHTFAVLEHIPGHDLKRTWMLRTPVLNPAPWNLHDEGHLKWLANTVNELDNALDAFHSRGWLLGDIHPKNVVMQDGVHPKFIDFEFAHALDPVWRSAQGAPGYEPAPGLGGVDADRWSLGVVELDLLLPQATLVDQGNFYKIAEVLDAAESSLGIDPSITDRIRQKTINRLTDTAPPDGPDPRSLSVNGMISAFASGILANINLDTDGPAIPADIAVYKEDKDQARVGYPFGLTGTLGALGVAGYALPDAKRVQAQQWITDRFDAIHSRGFSGRDGIELGLRQAGYLSVLDAVRTIKVPRPNDNSYWSGWAGVGLHALQDPFYTADDIEEAAEELQLLLEADTNDDKAAGLLHGWSAAAIFWALAYEQYEQRPQFIEHCIAAIKRDLAQCNETTKGTIELDEGWRTLPYLGTGSIAIGIAIRELNRVTGRKEFQHELSKIHAAATYNQYGQGGYAYGVSGFLPYLNLCAKLGDHESQEVTISHLDALRLHSICKDGGLLIRGNQGLRLSCDFLTGAAGVVGALASLEGRWSGIPFLPGTGNINYEERG